MFRIRLVPAVVLGALMMGIVFASVTPRIAVTPENVLTREQVMAIEQSCAEKRGKAMTSEAFKQCVDAGEDAAMAQAEPNK